MGSWWSYIHLPIFWRFVCFTFNIYSEFIYVWVFSGNIIDAVCTCQLFSYPDKVSNRSQRNLMRLYSPSEVLQIYVICLLYWKGNATSFRTNHISEHAVAFSSQEKYARSLSFEDNEEQIYLGALCEVFVVYCLEIHIYYVNACLSFCSRRGHKILSSYILWLIGWYSFVICLGDSMRLITGSADQSVKLWNVQTGAQLYSFNFDSPARSVDFSVGDKLAVITTDPFMGLPSTIQVKRIARDPNERMNCLTSSWTWNYCTFWKKNSFLL